NHDGELLGADVQLFPALRPERHHDHEVHAVRELNRRQHEKQEPFSTRQTLVKTLPGIVLHQILPLSIAACRQVGPLPRDREWGKSVRLKPMADWFAAARLANSILDGKFWKSRSRFGKARTPRPQ